MKLSTMEYRWKDYQSGVSFGLLACGVAFMAASLFMPIMPIEVYGLAITTIPAEAWALAVITASTMSIWGIYKNGRSKWSPLWRVAGYLIHLAIFLSLTAMAGVTVFGLYIAIYASVFFSTHMMFFIWINIADVINVFRS